MGIKKSAVHLAILISGLALPFLLMNISLIYILSFDLITFILAILIVSNLSFGQFKFQAQDLGQSESGPSKSLSGPYLRFLPYLLSIVSGGLLISIIPMFSSSVTIHKLLRSNLIVDPRYLWAVQGITGPLLPFYQILW